MAPEASLGDADSKDVRALPRRPANPVGKIGNESSYLDIARSTASSSSGESAIEARPCSSSFM
jgi:hypothetical protein